MDFQQSQTYINLQNAYAFQLQTSAKFVNFSVTADQEVFIEISNIFDTIARNERVIAQRLRIILNGGESDTLQNLIEATADEEYAETALYREYSRIASEEGYNDIASLFNGIGNIKLNHSILLQSATTDMINNEVFCKKEETLWICLACGNILSGVCAPEICPICGYPQGYYEVFHS